jgi:hypothetical protein
MTNFDYKKYSLEKLEEWMHDALSSGEASPHEIYSSIRKVVQEEYDYHDEQAKKCFGLLELLNGHRPVNLDDEVNDGMKPWGHSDLEYLFTNKKQEDEVVKWSLPVQVDGLTGDLYVNLPDDLLEKVGWKEGDMVEYVPSENGFYVMRKVNGVK